MSKDIPIINAEQNTSERKTDQTNIIQIQCGDIAVASSKDNLKQCGLMIKSLIKDKDIQNYLSDAWANKKVFGGSGIG